LADEVDVSREGGLPRAGGLSLEGGLPEAGGRAREGGFDGDDFSVAADLTLGGVGR